MFIELTDHLRCPSDHKESFLVLIPGEMTGRLVRRGTLGCPVCQREYPIEQGVVEFGPADAPVGEATGAMDAAAALALLGLEGPGGYVALVGGAAGLASGLAELLPGVHVAAVNPPAGTAPSDRVSVLRSPRLPLKARSLRGIVVGRPFADRPSWVEAAAGAVLPGLRVVGQGEPPGLAGLELLASAGGWWVGRV